MNADERCHAPQPRSNGELPMESLLPRLSDARRSSRQELLALIDRTGAVGELFAVLVLVLERIVMNERTFDHERLGVYRLSIDYVAFSPPAANKSACREERSLWHLLQPRWTQDCNCKWR